MTPDPNKETNNKATSTATDADADANAQPQGPNPERLFQILTAYQASAALKAAIELDIFTAVAEGADTAAALAEAAGVAERFHEIPGSAFDVDFGEGYDLALFTTFFHHFDRPTCVRLMRKVHAALKDGGRAVTLEFVPDETRVAPPAAATFALVMLSNAPAGDAYTFREYEEMFREAGFSRSESHPEAAPRSTSSSRTSEQ